MQSNTHKWKQSQDLREFTVYGPVPTRAYGSSYLPHFSDLPTTEALKRRQIPCGRGVRGEKEAHGRQQVRGGSTIKQSKDRGTCLKPPRNLAALQGT